MLKITIKTGRKEGFVSSYNLVFGNGLVLKTQDLTFVDTKTKAGIRNAFNLVVQMLKEADFTVEGEVGE